MKRALGFAVLLAMAGLWVATAAAEDKKRDNKDLDDRGFVMKVSECNLAEIALGNLAVRTARHEQVKKFAQQMVEEHTRANTELNQFANGKGIPVAPSMGRKHEECLRDMARAGAEDFDRKYMEQMVKGHEEAVELFEARAKNAEDKGVKELASKMLPKLREHLDKAKEIQSGLKQRKESDR